MKLGSVLYLPALHIAPERTAACLQNLLRWKHRYPIYIYSEAAWHPSLGRALSGPSICRFFRCPDPEPARMAEVVHALPKFIYLHGLKLVEEQGLDYFLTLEADSRVWGHYWDERIYDEFFSQQGKGRECVMGGTMFVWHPFNLEMETAEEFTAFFRRANERVQKGRPLPQVFVYGGKGSCQTHRAVAYPNGALSVCQTQFARSVFGPRDPLYGSKEGSAWDAHLGYGIFEQYGPQGFRRLQPLQCVFSVYGDLLTSEEERIKLLESGQLAGVHQVKSNWPITPIVTPK